MLKQVKNLLKKEPNLKARAIARKLGFDKTEVNSLLYKHAEMFVKDEDHQWSLIPSEVSITFAGAWVDCDSFESSLQSSSDDIEKATSIIFSLSNGCCFLLDALARFLALCNQLAFADKNVTVDFTNNGNLKHYLNRAGFFDHLDERVSVLPQRPEQSTAKTHEGNSKNLAELGEVTPHEDEDAKDQLVTRLTKKFTDLTSNDYKAAVSTIFAELTGNIQEHSKTQLKGFAGLQKYGKGKPHIQTVVSDSGLGIASTLRPSLQSHHKDLYKLYHQESLDNDIALVTKVMTDGLISRHGAGRGLGFKSSREHALKFKAKYSVRQESFSLEFLFENGVLKQVIPKKGLIKILGTHICFDFDID